MTSNAIREELEQAFQRIGGMDASLEEQLRAFSDATRQRQPQFADAVDRLVGRLRESGAGASAPHQSPFTSSTRLPVASTIVGSIPGGRISTVRSRPISVASPS